MRKVYLLLLLAVILGVPLLATRLLGDSSQEVIRRAEAFQEELTVEQLPELQGLPAYWLGETFRGLPVVKIKHQWDPGSADGVRSPREYVSVIYASCKPGQPEGGASAEAYCAPDEVPTHLEVRSEWLCLKPPSVLEELKNRQGMVDEARQVRGVRVYMEPDGDARFPFGESTVTIFTTEGQAVTMEAFDSLKGINPPGKAAAVTARSELGPPISEEECKDFTLPPAQPFGTPTPTAQPATPPPAPTLTPSTARTAKPAPTARPGAS